MKKSVFTLVIAGAVFIGYLSGCKKNDLPVIDVFTADPASDSLVTVGDTVDIICQVSDPDGNQVYYKLQANGGTLQGTPDAGDVFWIAPDQSGTFTLTCTVTDLEGDTVNVNSATLTIGVQNYFPMAVDNMWTYEGEAVIETITLETTVDSEENLGGGEVRWNITRAFDSSQPATDTFSYYTVKGDSVFFNDAAEQVEYLLLVLPLWQGKSWAASTGSTATVEEIKDKGPEAGVFTDCAKVEISGGSIENTIWLAPDVGIIEQTLQVMIGEIEGEIKFELVDYDLK